MKPTANQVARAATLAAHVGYTYDELDCQAFVEHCVRQAGARVRVERTRDGWSLVTALCTDGYTRRAWMMDAYLRR